MNDDKNTTMNFNQTNSGTGANVMQGHTVAPTIEQNFGDTKVVTFDDVRSLPEVTESDTQVLDAVNVIEAMAQQEIDGDPVDEPGAKRAFETLKEYAPTALKMSLDAIEALAPAAGPVGSVVGVLAGIGARYLSE